MKLDNTIKNILSSEEAETEYEELLFQSSILNTDELKHSRNAILGDNNNSSFHIRRIISVCFSFNRFCIYKFFTYFRYIYFIDA